jgi:hypothetical protein
MTNHIYYGEYSLKYWIHLLLTGDIDLPEYQRSFVWDESDVRRLIKSFKEKQFVQPVTIALFKTGKNSRAKNFLIDGQQRLTSILLAKIGFMPDRERFEKVQMIADGDDSHEDEDGEPHPIKWTFKEIIDQDPSKNSITTIKNKLNKDDRYLNFEVDNIDLDFWGNTFLGFSYIVPDSDKEQEVQHYFAQLFRNINYFGRRLSALESRQSLYYMDEDLRQYFEGQTNDNKNILCNLKIIESMKIVNLDFVRYLSILSQYKINNGSESVMLGYSAYKSRESYYADYVSYLLNLDQESRVNKFDGFKMNIVFPEKCWKERFNTLRNTINYIKENFNLNEKGAFSSWIDADYWLFGLIYQIVFEGKSLNHDITSLCSDLNNKIQEKRTDGSYSRIPNGLGNLRSRLAESINIYKDYVH